MALSRTIWIGLLAFCAWAGTAFAQTNEEELARANRAAMETFSRLEVTQARDQLEVAAQNARAAGVKGAALARTFANLGVVCVGGLHDKAAGLAAFSQALTFDPNVTIDPLFNAPDIEQVFALAKKAAKTASQSREPAQTSAPTNFESTLLHAPASEQLRETAIPVYVASAELGATHMRISYKGLGMPAAKAVEMQRTKDGFAFLIPCSVVFEPQVEYWIDALDDNGKTVGHAGTKKHPIVIPIVATRTKPAPALPGKPPPAQCGTDECPPGMAGCEDVGNGSAGLGDACDTQGDCAEGLSCADNVCTLEDGSEQAESSESGSYQHFFIDVGFTLGLAPVGKGHGADKPPPASLTTAAAALPADRRDTFLKDRGWACKTRPGPDTNGDGRADSSEVYGCDAHVTDGGLVSTLAVQLVAGYRFTPKAYGALMTRVQTARGDGTLAGILLGARGGYVLRDAAVNDFGIDLFGGAGVGQIQAQVISDGPYAVSGLAEVELGARGLYRFSRHVSVVLSPHAFVLFPSFLFDLDVTLGPQISF